MSTYALTDIPKDVLDIVVRVLLQHSTPVPYSRLRVTCGALHSQYEHYLLANAANTVIVEAYHYGFPIGYRVYGDNIYNFQYSLVRKTDLAEQILHPRHKYRPLLNFRVYELCYSPGQQKPPSGLDKYLSVTLHDGTMMVQVCGGSVRNRSLMLHSTGRKWIYRDNYLSADHMMSTALEYHEAINNIIPDILPLDYLAN